MDTKKILPPVPPKKVDSDPQKTQQGSGTPQPAPSPVKTDEQKKKEENLMGTPAPAPSSSEQKEEKKKLPVRTDANRSTILYKDYVDAHKQRKESKSDVLRKAREQVANSNSQSSQDKSKEQGKAPAQQQQQPASTKGNHQAPAEGTQEHDAWKYIDTGVSVVETGVGLLTDLGNVAADVVDFHDVKSPYGDILGTFTGAAGAALGTYGTVRSIMGTRNAAQNGDIISRNAGIMDSISGAIGVSGNLATMGSGIGGWVQGSESISGNVGNIVSGALGATGSALATASSSYKVNRYKSGRDKLGAMGPNQTDIADAKKEMNGIDLRGDKANKEQLQKFDNARQKLTNLKAKKYASTMGKKTADGKYKSAAWDTLGNVASVLSGLTGVAGGISGLAGSSAVKLASTVIGATLNLIPAATKHFNQISEKAKSHTNKKQVVDEYLNEKAKKIMDSANAGADEASQITLNEAKNIAIARLGIGDGKTITDTDQVESNRNTIFEKLIDKRAEYIFQADEATKGDILSAMGLDPKKATQAAIKEALGG